MGNEINYTKRARKISFVYLKCILNLAILLTFFPSAAQCFLANDILYASSKIDNGECVLPFISKYSESTSLDSLDVILSSTEALELIISDYEFQHLPKNNIPQLVYYCYSDAVSFSDLNRLKEYLHRGIAELEVSDRVLSGRLLLSIIEWKLGYRISSQRNLEIALARIPFVTSVDYVYIIYFQSILHAIYFNDSEKVRVLFQDMMQYFLVLNKTDRQEISSYYYVLTDEIKNSDVSASFKHELFLLDENILELKREIRIRNYINYSAIATFLLFLLFGFRYYKIKQTHRYYKKVMSHINSVVQDDTYISSSDFTLYALSLKVGYSKTIVIKAIKTTSQKTFAEWRSSRRIQYALDILHDKNLQEVYSMKGIGQQVGFKSPASFYSAFYKNVGVTPKQYLLDIAKKQSNDELGVLKQM